MHNKCHVLKSCPNHPPQPRSVEKLSSPNPVPGAEKVGDHCLISSGVRQFPLWYGTQHIVGSLKMSAFFLSLTNTSHGNCVEQDGERFNPRAIGSSGFSVSCLTHRRPSISLVFLFLSLKLLPAPWAALPPSPRALPGWWFLRAGPC